MKSMDDKNFGDYDHEHDMHDNPEVLKKEIADREEQLEVLMRQSLTPEVQDEIQRIQDELKTLVANRDALSGKK